MKEIEKPTEEKKAVTPALTPTVSKQPGQQEPVTDQSKKITDTPGPDEQKEEAVKGETTEQEKTSSETTAAAAAEVKESKPKE